CCTTRFTSWGSRSAERNATEGVPYKRFCRERPPWRSGLLATPRHPKSPGSLRPRRVRDSLRPVTQLESHQRRRRMRRSLFVAFCLSAVALLALVGGDAVSADKDKPTAEVPPRKGKSEKIQLFNGKDLEGWEGYQDLWSAKEGVIVAKNTKPLNYSTYL